MEKSYGQCAGDHAYDRALEKYPVLWWENIKVRFAIAIILVPVLARVQSEIDATPGKFWLSVSGVAISVLALLGDRVTTALVLRLKPQFDRRGLDFPTHEGNPLLPRFPTLRDQIFHWTNLLALVFLVVVFTKPLVAVLAVLIEGVQAFASLRIWYRLKRTLQYVEETRKHREISQYQAFV